MNIVSFSIVETVEGSYRVRAICPEVDSISLVDIVEEFELSNNWKPAGGYRGLVPDSYNFGPLDLYLLGKSGQIGLSGEGKVALLGCTCGEVGCWPLLSEVEEEPGLIIWQDFEQPYRKAWSYSAFGPFAFDAEQYRNALSAMLKQLDM